MGEKVTTLTELAKQIEDGKTKAREVHNDFLREDRGGNICGCALGLGLVGRVENPRLALQLWRDTRNKRIKEENSEETMAFLLEVPVRTVVRINRQHAGFHMNAEKIARRLRARARIRKVLPFIPQ